MPIETQRGGVVAPARSACDLGSKLTRRVHGRVRCMSSSGSSATTIAGHAPGLVEGQCLTVETPELVLLVGAYDRCPSVGV